MNCSNGNGDDRDRSGVSKKFLTYPSRILAQLSIGARTQGAGGVTSVLWPAGMALALWRFASGGGAVLASVPSLQLLERKRRREYLEEHTLANQLCLG